MDREIIFNKKKLILTLNSDADESVFSEIFSERGYAILDPIIKKTASEIIDIGAHIGLFSIYARSLNPSVPILALEPEPKNYETLKKNLKQNRIKNITTKNLAVASKTGSVVLNINKDSHNHSIILPGETAISVRSASLERIITRECGSSKCGLIKMDCEGAEFEIIASTPAETFPRIKAFYIEYHEFTPEMRKPEMRKESIKSTLEKHGFKTRIFPSHYDKRMGFILAVR